MKSLVAAVLLLATLLPYPVSAADPLTCSGYPEPRTFIEQSAYWQPPSGPAQEIELGSCFPNDGVIVRGTIAFDLFVWTDNLPAGARLTRVRITDASTTKWAATGTLTPGWFHATLNTDAWAAGRHELRFGAYVTNADGLVWFATGGWQLSVRATTPSYRSGPFTEARSWYPGPDYTNARIRSPLPLSGPSLVECAAPSGKPITRCRVLADTTVLHDSVGPWKGYVSAPHGSELRVESSSRVSTGTATGVVAVVVP